MKEIRFTGYSDDILDISGAFSDEISAFDETVIVGLSSESEDAQLSVFATYAPKVRGGNQVSCWVIGVQNADEGVHIPEWDIKVVQCSCEYSPTLVVTAPDDVKLHRPD